jgi:23S rRNA pseudouridine1911/1915/1917 synthase
MPKYTVTDKNAGKRLDVFVHKKFSELSRSFVGKLIDQGRVAVNDQTEKAGYKLHAGDKIAVNFKVSELGKIPKINLPILYEDDDCIVIDKPEGILTHSKGTFNLEATVATFVKQYIQDHKTPISEVRPLKNILHHKTHNSGVKPRDWLNDGISTREGIVHRLDRATSGVIICAKTPEAQSWLQKQFSSRKVKKQYIAVVSGHMREKNAMIDIPIERNPKNPKSFRVGVGGKHATTEYKVLVESDAYSLLDLHPATGRTHQLRVHLKQIGHPIVGDPVYGGEPFKRLLLHAQKLEITLPSRERKVFEAKLPKVFHDIMK